MSLQLCMTCGRRFRCVRQYLIDCERKIEEFQKTCDTVEQAIEKLDESRLEILKSLGIDRDCCILSFLSHRECDDYRLMLCAFRVSMQECRAPFMEPVVINDRFNSPASGSCLAGCATCCAKDRQQQPASSSATNEIEVVSNDDDDDDAFVPEF